MKGDWKQCIAYADYVLGNAPGATLRPWISYQEQLEGRRERLHEIYCSPQTAANLMLASTESRLSPLDRHRSLRGNCGDRRQDLQAKDHQG